MEMEWFPSSGLSTQAPDEEPRLTSSCVLCNTTCMCKPKGAGRQHSGTLTEAIRHPRSLLSREGLKAEDDSLSLIKVQLEDFVFCCSCDKKLRQMRLVLDKLGKLQLKVVEFQTEVAHQLRLSLDEAHKGKAAQRRGEEAESNRLLRSLRKSILRELNGLQPSTQPHASAAATLSRCVVRLTQMEQEAPPECSPPDFLSIQIKQEPDPELLQVTDLQVFLEDRIEALDAETANPTTPPSSSNSEEFLPSRASTRQTKRQPNPKAKSACRKKRQATGATRFSSARPDAKEPSQPSCRRKNARRYACQFPGCGHASVRTSHLPTHVLKCHFNGPAGLFLCWRCGAHFPGQRAQLVAHEVAHAEEEQTLFSCRLCSQSFRTLSKLCDHFRRRHPTEERPTRADFPRAIERPTDVLLGLHTCPHCLQEFNNPIGRAWRNHLDSHTKPCACAVERCGARFSKATYLRFHVIRFHPELAGHPGYSCPHCPYVTNRPQTLKSHVKVRHEGAFEGVCSVPGCSFRSPEASRLKLHVERVHEGRRDFLCTECGKGFSLQNKLTAHMRSHTGEKPFGCGVCGKRFRLRAMLKRHEPIHGTERPFICELCGARFPTRNNLTGHRHSWHKNGLHRVGVPPTRRSKYDDSEGRQTQVAQESGAAFHSPVSPGRELSHA